MKNFQYVYILTDIATETLHCAGSTQDIQARLVEHNAGDGPQHPKTDAYVMICQKKHTCSLTKGE